MEFSRCTQAGGPPYEKAPYLGHGLSKLNSVRKYYVEVDVVSRRTESSDEDLERSTSTSSAPAGVKALLHP
jgi:hypothetical protein